MGANDRYVVRHGSHWAVKKGGAEGASGRVYPTQAAAVEAAKQIVRDKGGTVRVHGSDGRVRESFTIGREGFAKISAVEGIRLSNDMEQALREFDSRGLSPEERRRELVSRYGKKPA